MYGNGDVQNITALNYAKNVQIGERNLKMWAFKCSGLAELCK